MYVQPYKYLYIKVKMVEFAACAFMSRMIPINITNMRFCIQNFNKFTNTGKRLDFMNVYIRRYIL